MSLDAQRSESKRTVLRRGRSSLSVEADKVSAKDLHRPGLSPLAPRSGTTCPRMLSVLMGSRSAVVLFQRCTQETLACGIVKKRLNRRLPFDTAKRSNEATTRRRTAAKHLTRQGQGNADHLDMGGVGMGGPDCGYNCHLTHRGCGVCGVLDISRPYSLSRSSAYKVLSNLLFSYHYGHNPPNNSLRGATGHTPTVVKTYEKTGVQHPRLPRPMSTASEITPLYSPTSRRSLPNTRGGIHR